MDFNLSDVQAVMRDTAERVVREHCTLHRRRERIARGEGFDTELTAHFADLGWLALCIPEEEGGLGGSMTDIALLMIELGRGMSVEPIISSALLCAHLLSDAGWAGRTEWIEDVMSGGKRLAFANRESEDRSERPARRLTTVQGAQDKLAISGAKVMVWDGDAADAFLVTASSPPTDDLVLALVPRTARGVDVRSYPLIDGLRAADIFLDQVEIDETDIVARGEDASLLIEDAVSRATAATLAAAVGSMEACIELCSDYLKTRSQFGQPLGKFQALQHMMAEMLVTAHNARSMLYHLLSKFGINRDVRAAAIASAKLMIGQAGLMVSRSGIQLHGGYGITDEYAISHHHRFLYALEKRFGDSHHYAERLAGLVFGPDRT
jgi:alkylation response protein AidB-like acyl-CoA dehydrogenase